MAVLPLEMPPSLRAPVKMQKSGMEGQAAPAHIPHRPQGGMVPEAPLWPSEDTLLVCQEDERGTGHMENNLLDLTPAPQGWSTPGSCR